MFAVKNTTKHESLKMLKKNIGSLCLNKSLLVPYKNKSLQLRRVMQRERKQSD